MPKVDHRRNLTPTLVKGLKAAPAGQRYQVMDTQVPGFGVRVTDTGHRSFILRARFPGSSSASRREIGSCVDLTLSDAREKARSWRSLLSQGLDPAAEEERRRRENLRKQTTTFAAVAEAFIQQKLPGERKGKDVEREIRRDLLPAWDRLSIHDVSDSHVAELIKAKGRDGKIGARNLLALIKRFFRWVAAQPEFGLAASPCANLRAPDILGEMPRSKGRILTDDEMFALWRAAGRLPKPVGAVYKILCLTALRLNEAADGSRGEIDRRQKIWVIPAERMKGKDAGKKQARPHALPLTDDLLKLLDALPKHDEGSYLFSGTSGRTPVWITTKIKQRLDRRMLRTLRAMAKVRGEDPAGIVLKPFMNHDIRRTVRSHLSRLKVTEEAREAILAHARPGIKGTYDLHDYFDEKREALQLWHARLRSIVDPPEDNVIKLRATA